MIIKLFSRSWFLMLLLVLLPNYLVNAQTNKEPSQNIFQTIGSDFQIAFMDGYHLLVSPAKFSTNDWLVLGGVTASTAAMMPFDEDLRKYAKRNSSDFNDNIMNVGKAYGSGFSPVIIGGGIYSYGLFFKNESVRTTGRMVLESVVYAGMITTILKSLTGRSRPYTNEGANFYQPIQFNTAHTSFPSGHSTVAFAISSVLSNRIHNTYASIGLYSLAALTSVSRVYHDDHWASDVILGSAIGFFVGNYISHNSGTLYLNKEKKITLKIMPSLNGLYCNLSF